MTHLPTLERRSLRVLLMGIVNRTPDSFSDGGKYLNDPAAHARVEQLLEQGADIVDIGAESTRPGAPAIAAREQIARLGDLIAFTVARGAKASVDTTSPEVAAHALSEGANIINSVSLEPAAELGRIAARAGADLVLTHCRGSMTDMGGFSQYSDHAYDDVVKDVAAEWSAAAQRAIDAGLDPSKLVLDPGLGFAKNAEQSLELCARLRELKALGHRVLVGTSRKSYIAQSVAGHLSEEPAPADQRLGGTIAATVDCVRNGADIVRVHDVAEVRQALAYMELLEVGRA